METDKQIYPYHRTVAVVLYQNTISDVTAGNRHLMLCVAKWSTSSTSARSRRGSTAIQVLMLRKGRWEIPCFSKGVCHIKAQRQYVFLFSQRYRCIQTCTHFISHVLRYEWNIMKSTYHLVDKLAFPAWGGKERSRLSCRISKINLKAGLFF